MREVRILFFQMYLNIKFIIEETQLQLQPFDRLDSIERLQPIDQLVSQSVNQSVHHSQNNPLRNPLYQTQHDPLHSTQCVSQTNSSGKSNLLWEYDMARDNGPNHNHSNSSSNVIKSTHNFIITTSPNVQFSSLHIEILKSYYSLISRAVPASSSASSPFLIHKDPYQTGQLTAGHASSNHHTSATQTAACSFQGAGGLPGTSVIGTEPCSPRDGIVENRFEWSMKYQTSLGFSIPGNPQT